VPRQDFNHATAWGGSQIQRNFPSASRQQVPRLGNQLSQSEPSAATTAIGNVCKSSTMFSGNSLSISSDVPFSLNRATNHGAPPTHGSRKESRDDRRSARSYASQLSEKPDGDNSFSSGIPYLVNIPVSTEEKYCKSFGRICNNAMRSNGFSGCAINKSDEVKVGKDGLTARRVQLRCISKLCTWRITALAPIPPVPASAGSNITFRVSSWPTKDHSSDDCFIGISKDNSRSDHDTEFTPLRDFPPEAVSLIRQWLHTSDPAFRPTSGNTEVATSFTTILNSLGFDVTVSPNQVFFPLRLPVTKFFARLVSNSIVP
jgi:hypothetical protein